MTSADRSTAVQLWPVLQRVPPPKANPNGEQHAVHVEGLIGVAVKDLTRDNLKRFGTHDGLIYLFYRKMLNLLPFLAKRSSLGAAAPESDVPCRAAASVLRHCLGKSRSGESAMQVRNGLCKLYRGRRTRELKAS